jgi:hypothetical protein
MEGTVMRIDYSTLEALHQQARRERAQAIYRLLVAPVARLFHKRPTFAPLRSRLA